MSTTTSNPILWTEMTDDLSEAVNGGGWNKYCYYYEKPKKKECAVVEEPTYCWKDKQYDKCNSYKSKSW
jgi:hypothetical protein